MGIFARIKPAMSYKVIKAISKSGSPSLLHWCTFWWPLDPYGYVFQSNQSNFNESGSPSLLRWSTFCWRLDPYCRLCALQVACNLASSEAASIPATSEYSCLASAKLKESSFAAVTFPREMSIQSSRWPTLHLSQIPLDLWVVSGPTHFLFLDQKKKVFFLKHEGDMKRVVECLEYFVSYLNIQLLSSCHLRVFYTRDSYVTLFAVDCHPRNIFESKVCHSTFLAHKWKFEEERQKLYYWEERDATSLLYRLACPKAQHARFENKKKLRPRLVLVAGVTDVKILMLGFWSFQLWERQYWRSY